MRVEPVITTLQADLLTPLGVFLQLGGQGSDSFLLESVEGGANVARYSFIGAGPYMTARAVGNDTEIVSDGEKRKLVLPFFEFLRQHLSKFGVCDDVELPPFVCGAIGYVGFDCIGLFEPSPASIDHEKHLAMFMFFNSVVAFDHAKQLITVITLTANNETNVLSTPEKAQEINRSIVERLRSVPSFPSDETGPVRGSEAASFWDQSEFENAVAAVKESINAGECYQVVLSRLLRRETGASALSIYRALRNLNPSPYMFLLNIEGRSIIGSSPEMLVRCINDRLDYRPIAGTRPRGKDPTEDERLANEMRVDPKEVAEHMMLVDLGRNDLGRVAKFGTVKLNAKMKVEKYSHVQHLVSELSAELAVGKDRFDAFAACFPAGTVSGAPKVRAIEIIRELEPVSRGVYAGAVGYFDHAGNMDTCIAIRTIVLEDGAALIQTGAGIVADSDPRSEFHEIENKAAALLRAIDLAERSADREKSEQY